MKPLEAEFDYYLSNQDNLVKQHKGKFIVVKGEQVIGVYDTEEKAIRKTLEEHELGTFLVQFVEAGQKSTSQTFHSRVFFDAKS